MKPFVYVDTIKGRKVRAEKSLVSDFKKIATSTEQKQADAGADKGQSPCWLPTLLSQRNISHLRILNLEVLFQK